MTGAKETRCEPYESQVAIKNVRLLIGTSEQPAKWVKEFLEEHEMYGPSAEFKDQIDAAGGAFNKLAGAGGGVFLDKDINFDGVPLLKLAWACTESDERKKVASIYVPMVIADGSIYRNATQLDV